MSTFIMDTVTTDSKTYVGIIDFITTKHVIFYDFTQNNCPDLVTMAIVWKTYFYDLRFSIFVSLYFNHLDVGSPIMINRKSIQAGIENMHQTKPKRKVIKKFTTQSPKD